MGGLSQLPLAAARLQGKVALITGGAKGIGACMTRLFCQHVATVVIADIHDDRGIAVANEIGPELATYIHCDVTKESDIETAVKTTISKHRKLDIMVNNAAIIDDIKPNIVDNDVDDFERVIRVNLVGPFLGTKHAARVMIPKRKGSIIMVGSVSSTMGGMVTHAYTSSKHGLLGLTKNAAAELGKYGIRVNCVSPYFVANEAGREYFKMDDDGEECHGIYSNLKGVSLKEEDVARAALYLASDESTYISGHNLAVDGGFTSINPMFGIFSPSRF